MWSLLSGLRALSRGLGFFGHRRVGYVLALLVSLGYVFAHSVVLGIGVAICFGVLWAGSRTLAGARHHGRSHSQRDSYRNRESHGDRNSDRYADYDSYADGDAHGRSEWGARRG